MLFNTTVAFNGLLSAADRYGILHSAAYRYGILHSAAYRYGILHSERKILAKI